MGDIQIQFTRAQNAGKKVRWKAQSEDKNDGRENIQLQIAPPPPTTRPEHNDFTWTV